MLLAAERASASGGAVWISLLFVVLYFVGYAVPAIIAIRRDHPSKMAIVAVTILLGWTFIGWIIAFVWALTTPAKTAQPVVVQTFMPPPGYGYPPQDGGHGYPPPPQGPAA